MLTKLQKKHRRFIASECWAKIRADIITVRGYKCENCGSEENIHVHHVSYKNFGGGEEPEDLLLLCDICHTTEHARQKKKWKKKKKKGKNNKPQYLVRAAQKFKMSSKGKNGYIAWAKAIYRKTNGLNKEFTKASAKHYVKEMVDKK